MAYSVSAVDLRGFHAYTSAISPDSSLGSAFIAAVQQ